MGHTRLGAVPKTRKWNEILEQIAGSAVEGGNIVTTIDDIDEIAARTLEAGQKALEKASNDPGVSYTFYFLTQIALASRTADWQDALGNLGIHLGGTSTVFELTAEIQDAVDRRLSSTPRGSSDLSEMAQQAAGEAIASLAGPHTATLFGTSSAD
ncbi:MAG: hypothetical protein ACRD18_16990 [Terriglobia bacterium]